MVDPFSVILKLHDSLILLVFGLVPIQFFTYLTLKILLFAKNPLAELTGLELLTGSFTLRKLRAATNDFHSENKIGEGGFGSVYRV